MTSSNAAKKTVAAAAENVTFTMRVEPSPTAEPELPQLRDVLPAAASAMGYGIREVSLEFPAAKHVVVVLVDGLGAQQLQRRTGHAPFLGGLIQQAPNWRARCAFPSTTATSITSLGTGLEVGQHGMVGTEVLDPQSGELFSLLAWDSAVDPVVWQPHPTVFEQLATAGVDVVRIGPGYFDGSGLTQASSRGGRYRAAETLPQRVDACVDALRSAAAPSMVYLYWGDIDKAGHIYGWGSWQWSQALAHVDECLADLVNRLPEDVLVVMTADHGMVDIPFDARYDLATEPELAAGIRLVGGEPRALHLYCYEGAARDVAAVWQERTGADMDVVSREQAVADGWFGAVADAVLPRLGDVVVRAHGEIAVVDSRTARPELLRLRGLHGGRDEAETHIPLLAVVGRA